MLFSTCHRGARVITPSTSIEPAPIAAAGAGPSSAIARTMARNDAEMRNPRNSIVMTSLPAASTNSSSTSSIGCQSAALEPSKATTYGGG